MITTSRVGGVRLNLSALCYEMKPILEWERLQELLAVLENHGLTSGDEVTPEAWSDLEKVEEKYRGWLYQPDIYITSPIHNRKVGDLESILLDTRKDFMAASPKVAGLIKGIEKIAPSIIAAMREQGLAPLSHHIPRDMWIKHGESESYNFESGIVEHPLALVGSLNTDYDYSDYLDW